MRVRDFGDVTLDIFEMTGWELDYDSLYRNT